MSVRRAWLDALADALLKEQSQPEPDPVKVEQIRRALNTYTTKPETRIIETR